MIDSGGTSRGGEMIDLAALPCDAVADVRYGGEVAAYDIDEEYDPGWLGVVLRWPMRVAAVVVILPVQVVWQSVKGAGRAVGRGLRRVGRATGTVLNRCVGRPARFVGRWIARGAAVVGGGLAWVSTRVVWRPLRWLGRGIGVGILIGVDGLGAAAMWVLRPIGHGIVVVLKVIAVGLDWFADVVMVGALAVGRPLGRAMRWVGRRVGAGLRKVGRGIRWTAVGVGHGIALVARMLFVPIALAGRGIWFVLKLVGGWLVGLGHVIGDALAYGWRVGAKVGRGVVWLWRIVAWNPLKWLGRGLKTGWLAVWHPLRAAAKAAIGPIRSVVRRARLWYRHEISGPVRAAVAAARRDVRRAIGRR